MKQFGEKLRDIRKNQRFSQAEVGDAIGVTSQAISSYEKGRRVPPVEIVEALAAFFGVKPSYFLDGAGGEYYISKDTAEKAQELFENSGMRMLFDAARDCRPEDLQLAADLLRRLKDTGRE